MKCHQDENYEYKAMTYAPGNAFDTRSYSLTFNFVAFCLILSLALNLIWIISKIPCVADVETPNITSNDDMLLENTDLNPLAEPFIPLLAEYTFNDMLEQPPSGNVSSIDDLDDPTVILKQLKSTNTERPVIATLKH